MDKFTGIMRSMEMMSPEERTKKLEDTKPMCICPRCPTYDNCAKAQGELLFCAVGKSSCALVKKNCLCPACPVTALMGLEHAYFCIRSSEKGLRGM